jgi:hypothetical protein
MSIDLSLNLLNKINSDKDGFVYLEVRGRSARDVYFRAALLPLFWDVVFFLEYKILI